MSLRKALIVVKKDNAAASALAAELRSWLAGRRVECLPPEMEDEKSAISEAPDIAISLGGDGTILGLARKLAGKNTPIFGINFGRVGFLTSAQPDAWRQSLDLALAGELPMRNCLALKWSLWRCGRRIANGHVVNDVVLGHGQLARLIKINLSLNGEKLGALRSDALVVCSPLGSSGYSVSAGGPLLYAEMAAIGLTPVCAFQNNVFPLVFPADSVFELDVAPPGGCYLTLDGQECLKLEEFDRVQTQGWPDAVKIFGSKNRFFERLRARGFNLENMDQAGE